MDALINAGAQLLGKITDPVVIVLLILLFMSEWMRITQGREERKDRNEVLVPALKEVTEAMHDIKNALSAATGKAL